MQLTKHITEQPFVAATASAALMHSTWSLGTLFAGTQPEAGLTIAFMGWLVPALLIAFSMDIGMLATASDIRSGQRSKAKYLTFAVLALSMYFLQWLYIAHHMPALALGAGVNAAAVPIATGLRDAALWLIPGLLPLSVLLYTFSTAAIPSQGKAAVISANVNAADLPTDVTQETPAVAAPARTANGQKAKGKIAVQCQDCDWHGEYSTERSATNALLAHRKHCTGVKVSANGKTAEPTPT
jgi:hypothetical protein